MDSVVDRLTTYANGPHVARVSDAALDRTKDLVVDGIGCALGGFGSPPYSVAASLARKVRAEVPATVLVEGIRTTPDLAAFANGIMVRYLDYNDAYIGRAGGVHPSDLLAAALAVGEYVSASGRDLLLSLVLGYEILGAFADAATTWPRTIDQSTFVLIAAVLMCSRLLDMDSSRMQHALSIALSSHVSLGQIRAGQLSDWKGCAAANAVRNAVFSSIAAFEGMTGPNNIFEGPRGLLALFGTETDILGLLDGRTSRIVRACMKAYPAGIYGQAAIEAAIQVRRELCAVEHIERIEVVTFPEAIRVMASDQSRWEPTVRETADHSLPFVVALALLYGTVDIAHYAQELYLSDYVRRLMKRINVRENASDVLRLPEEMPTWVRVETSCGRTMNARVANPRGHYKRPMTQDEVAAKFRALAGRSAGLATNQIDELVHRLRHLEAEPSISEVLRLTARAPRHQKVSPSSSEPRQGTE